MANSSKQWLYWSAPRCEQSAADKEHASLAKTNCSAGDLYAVSMCYRCRSVQVSCWEEPGFGTSQEASGVHVYPRMQRGWNVCSGLSHNFHRSLFLIFFTLHLSLNLNHPLNVFDFTNIYLFASAGPVPYSDRLLLVCHQWWQASEWLLCAQQDPGVFRYWEEKTAWQPEDEIFQKNLKMFVPYKVGDVLT